MKTKKNNKDIFKYITVCEGNFDDTAYFASSYEDAFEDAQEYDNYLYTAKIGKDGCERIDLRQKFKPKPKKTAVKAKVAPKNQRLRNP